MKRFTDQRITAKELLEQLKNLNEGDLNENLKLQKKLEKISKINDDDYYDIENLVKLNQYSDVIVKSWGFIDNNGQHSFDSEIISTPESDFMKIFLKCME